MILTRNFAIEIQARLVDHIWIPCQVLGYPQPSVQWVFGLEKLTASRPRVRDVKLFTIDREGNNIFIESSYEMFANGSLLIDNPYEPENIVYDNFTCVASSFLGKDTKTHQFSFVKCKCIPSRWKYQL